MAAAAAALVAGVACSEQTPTSIDGNVLPVAPVTIEVEIPWEGFGSDLVVLGGYGSPSDLGRGYVANAHGGSLQARTLARFGIFPRSASVRDTAGTTQTDTMISITGGRLVAFFDTIASTNAGPVTLELGALQEEWDARSATWTSAVDSVGEARPWSAAGGGAVTSWGTAEWDPADGDSLSFVLDSAQVAAWVDTADASRGARIDLITPGSRLELRDVALRLEAVPSVNPDTVVQLSVPDEDLTFIYDPAPAPPPDGVRIGGVPGWRTVLDVTMPTQLNGPPALCAAVGCPVALEPEEVSYAALVLTSRATDAAYQPSDSIGLDVRPVLLRSALPKAPLGATLVGSRGQRMHPSLFGGAEGTRVEVPITAFLRQLVAGADSVTQEAPPNTLALLSTFEPFSLSFASFYGPGSPQAPMLKLIVTVGPSVELP